MFSVADSFTSSSYTTDSLLLNFTIIHFKFRAIHPINLGITTCGLAGGYRWFLLPFLKGKKVEVLIIVEEDETDYVSQNNALMQQIELSKKTHQERTGYKPTDEQMNAILSVWR